MSRPKKFSPGDLVLQKVLGVTKDLTHEKLSPNWEDPYRVASYVEHGKKLPRPWNAKNMKKFYQ